MVLNDTEIREKVQRHCGNKIAKSEQPCESCQKKLAIAKNIAKQKDFLWRQHDDWMKQQRDRSRREMERHV
jgi:hypothetical protein